MKDIAVFLHLESNCIGIVEYIVTLYFVYQIRTDHKCSSLSWQSNASLVPLVSLVILQFPEGYGVDCSIWQDPDSKCSNSRPIHVIIEVHTLMARVAQDLAVECCFISWVLWSRSLNIHILSCVDKNNSLCHSNNSQMVSSLTITIFTRDIHHQIAYLYSVFFFIFIHLLNFPGYGHWLGQYLS